MTCSSNKRCVLPRLVASGLLGSACLRSQRSGVLWGSWSHLHWWAWKNNSKKKPTLKHTSKEVTIISNYLFTTYLGQGCGLSACNETKHILPDSIELQREMHLHYCTVWLKCYLSGSLQTVIKLLPPRKNGKLPSQRWVCSRSTHHFLSIMGGGLRISKQKGSWEYQYNAAFN